MAIHSVSSNVAQYPVNSLLQSPPPVRAKREPDADKDDRAAAIRQASAPAPTVNANGQIIGSTLSVTA